MPFLAISTFDAIDTLTAGNAAELETAAAAAIAAAEGNYIDASLTGGSDGTLWQMWLVRGTLSEGREVSTESAVVLAAVAGNKAEAYASLQARIAAYEADSEVTLLPVKFLIAGAGVGSDFLAAAFLEIQGGG